MEEEKIRKFSNLKIGTILVIVFLLIYLPSLYHWVYGIDIGTDIVRAGTLEETINTDAFLVRDEITFVSPFDGTYIPGVGEGEKIPVNFNVATVLKKSSQDLLKKLKETDLKIIKAQKQKIGDDKLFSEDIMKIDSEIEHKLKLIISGASENNITDERELQEGVNLLIQKKVEIIGQSAKSDAYTESLKKERAGLEKIIQENTKEIESKVSGIVSYTLDGYESQLTPKTIKKLTPEVLGSIKADVGTSGLHQKEVQAQKPFVKVIKNFEYYLVAILDKNKIQNFKQGKSVTIRIGELNKTLRGSIDSVSENHSGKYLLSIKTDQNISDVARLRKINIDLVVKHFNGLKVPLSSLKEMDSNKQRAKIVIVDANYATIKEVSIVGRDSEFAIIESVSKDKNSLCLYDIFVTKPGNIKEGQMINQ